MTNKIHKINASFFQSHLADRLALVVHRGLLRREWSAENLSVVSGVTLKTIQQILDSKGNPSVRTIGRIAHALGVRLRFAVDHVKCPATYKGKNFIATMIIPRLVEQKT